MRLGGGGGGGGLLPTAVTAAGGAQRLWICTATNWWTTSGRWQVLGSCSRARQRPQCARQQCPHTGRRPPALWCCRCCSRLCQHLMLAGAWEELGGCWCWGWARETAAEHLGRIGLQGTRDGQVEFAFPALGYVSGQPSGDRPPERRGLRMSVQQTSLPGIPQTWYSSDLCCKTRTCSREAQCTAAHQAVCQGRRVRESTLWGPRGSLHEARRAGRKGELAGAR